MKIELKCVKCGKSFVIGEKQSRIWCPYCGQVLNIIDNKE
jgi:DNA-directed RNA polymerase subunit RPC12/RpoP